MKVTVAFATETGTAQNLSEKLLWKLKCIAKPGRTDLEACSVAELSDEWIEPGEETAVVVFIIATSGEGEVTNSMKGLWSKLLNARLPKDFLADSARCAIFGLGDSSYEKFNAAARKFRARIIQLGATEVCPAGAGDDQADTELAFDRWAEQLISELRRLEPEVWRDVALDLATQPTEPPKYALTYDTSMAGRSAPDFRVGSDVELVANDRITSQDWNQDVRHIEFACSDSYEPGDVLNIWPRNDPDIVDQFLVSKYPELDPLLPFKCEPTHPTLPMLISPRQVLIEYLDMNNVPSRFFFQQASNFCTDKEEKEKMLEMVSYTDENAAAYITYCKRERRTYFEVLQDFASCFIPFAYLLDLVPPLRPRAFSISSSPSVHAGRIHITVALVQYVTPYKRMKVGTCSAFLRSLGVKDNPKVRTFITSGTLRLPANLQSPMVLIGTGTGCAPMRSLLHERACLTKGLPLRATRLYFGCRNSTADYLYKDEWPSVCDDVRVAFSKQSNQRVPVLLAKDSAIIYNQLITLRGYIYISGSAKKMPADVRETIVQVLCKEGHLSREDAVKTIRQLEKERRYVVEAWS